jgi:small GTP-binding protein
VNIALIGQRGAGKSTLVNAIRGKPGIAEIGVETDVTKSRVQYDWNDIRIIDSPGYGTKKFPRKHFLKSINIENIDLFIFVISGKLGEDDIEIFNEARKNGRKHVIVRNFMDAARISGVSEEGVQARVKSDILRQLGEENTVLLTVADLGEGVGALVEVINENAARLRRERFDQEVSRRLEKIVNDKRLRCVRSAAMVSLTCVSGRKPAAIKNAIKNYSARFHVPDDYFEDISAPADGQKIDKDQLKTILGLAANSGPRMKALSLAVDIAPNVMDVFLELCNYIESCADQFSMRVLSAVEY